MSDIGKIYGTLRAYNFGRYYTLICLLTLSCNNEQISKSTKIGKDSIKQERSTDSSQLVCSPDTFHSIYNIQTKKWDSTEYAEYERSQYVEKSFIIIASTKNLKEAISMEKKAEHLTGIPFHKAKDEIDTLNGGNDTCKAYAFQYPCYDPRGRYDDGIFFSIESSNYYDGGFTKDLFIIMAGSGPKENQELKTTLIKVKQYFPDSYIKNTKIYMGCNH